MGISRRRNSRLSLYRLSGPSRSKTCYRSTLSRPSQEAKINAPRGTFNEYVTKLYKRNKELTGNREKFAIKTSFCLLQLLSTSVRVLRTWNDRVVTWVPRSTSSRASRTRLSPTLVFNFISSLSSHFLSLLRTRESCFSSIFCGWWQRKDSYTDETHTFSDSSSVDCGRFCKNHIFVDMAKEVTSRQLFHSLQII